MTSPRWTGNTFPTTATRRLRPASRSTSWRTGCRPASPNCLLARRLLERGVRFVQLMHSGWDQHGNLSTQLAVQCRDTDQPTAALVKDLKQRGLLDDTIVLWGGEFGRTVFVQGDINNPNGHGRDHLGTCY